MKKILLFLMVLLASLSAWAQNEIPIDSSNFPDANFRNYLLSQPYGSDGVLTDGEIAAIIIIDVASKSIADLTGIEHFTALQALYCSINQLTELDVSHNTALIFLACNNNQLTGLDVSHNTALDVLYCFNNPLTELDVSHNTALSQLNCSNNQLTELDVSHNTALEALDCSNNSLTELEVSQNTALEALYCYNNQLTELEVSQNTALKRLGCSNNPLTGLDVSYNTALTQLYCSNIQLAELDVSHNTALGGLDCSNNSLTELDVSQNTAMDVFECYNNQLTELDVSQNTALGYLDCSGNQINGGNMEALVASLPTVDVDYWGENGSFIVIDLDSETEQNVITTTQVATARGKNWTVYGLIDDDWQEYAGSAEGLPIDSVNFPDANFRNYLLSEPYGSDGVLTDGEIAAIITIDVASKSIADLTGIEHLTALQNLYCDNNQLTELDMSHNTALILLVCNNNQLTGLDVSHNTALNKLYCYNNQLTALDVCQDTALKNLNCSDNQLTELDVSQNTALETLDCSNNSLTELEVSQNTALEALYCNNNQLTELEVSQNTALMRLDCSDNQLTELDVSYNTALKTLRCSNIQLTELDVSQNTALEVLRCSNNQLTALDVSQNTALEVLYCSNNQLTALNVSQNTALGVLDCSGNQINGGNMEALVASLPTVDVDYWGENGSFIVIDLDSETEQNVITTTQVATARGKNWTVYGLIDDDWQEYAGSEPTYYAITLAEALESGSNGDNVTLSDTLAVVQKTEDGALTYVTDGNGHWARLEGDAVADLVVGSGITSISGELTNMGVAPTIVLADAPTEADAPDYQIMPLDLQHHIAEPPAPCQVVSVRGFYDGMKIRAFQSEPQGQGLLINADHTSIALQIGHLYEIVGAIELLEPWDNDASGAPRRVKATDDDFLDNMYLMLIGGEETIVTSITDLAAYYDKDIEAIYTLDGMRVESVSNGVYIIQFKDGSVKKVLF